ncbi:MAG: cysteine rich repeat-containing protein [Nitrospirota bacterium]|nr:cysteine rich repeat-containing protein [Nitrospirota bacterium]
MAQQQSSSGIMAGAMTLLGLGLVWGAVAVNFPSQEELSSAAVPAAHPSSPVPAPPELDLTIPGAPPMTSSAVVRPRRGEERPSDTPVDVPAETRFNPRAAQVAKLRCESEIEELCPDSPDGAARTRCLEQRARKLSPLCQSQVRERFVKWKEDRGRMMAACEEDVKKFCPDVVPGGGQILQCLQSNAPDVSDRCYETLPKGMLYVQ